MNDYKPHPSSFRDPSGFIFFQEGVIYRQINKFYQEDYDLLVNSGLLSKLHELHLLIPSVEVDLKPVKTGDIYKIIRPEKIPFISYPYEWCFSQLKDVALTLLQIQKIALDFGMILKDASAYNLQFYGGRPILIDTLSFEKYQEKPWVAYRQFCRHFLAPLTLMNYVDSRLNNLMRVFLDGVPLDLATKMLPYKSRFNLSLLMHLYLQVASQKKYAAKPLKKEITKLGKNALLRLIENLEGTVRNLKWKGKTEWGDYYNSNNNYSDESFKNKEEVVGSFLTSIKPKNVWDLGANTGFFSRLSSDQGILTLSLDKDPLAVEANYQIVKQRKEQHLLPLMSDITNPSPALGWENKERDSLLARGPADTVLALALIHHLAISNNLPLEKMAEFFRIICSHLIIEFIPKDDPQVKRLLASRQDIFAQYTLENFEKAFGKVFKILKKVGIKHSQRSLYLMQKVSA